MSLKIGCVYEHQALSSDIDFVGMYLHTVIYFFLIIAMK